MATISVGAVSLRQGRARGVGSVRLTHSRVSDQIRAREQVRELRLARQARYGSVGLTSQAARPSPEWSVPKRQMASSAQLAPGRRTARRLALMVAVALAAAILIALPAGTGSKGGDAYAGIGSSGLATAEKVVIVAPGDGLWRIAERMLPEIDPRDGVGRIVEMNNLGSEAVVPGQRLRIPSVS